MTFFLRPLLFLICIACCTPGWAQALKGPKACRTELRQHAAEIRSAKVKRRDFLAACRKTAVGQDTPIGDKATPAPVPEGAAPPQPTPAPASPPPPPPAADPAPQPAPAQVSPPPAAEPAPPAAEPAQAPKPEAAAPAQAPKAVKPPAAEQKPPAPTINPAAEAAPAEDHTLPGWWNWTMRLAALAALAVAVLFAVRGLMRIRKAGG